MRCLTIDFTLAEPALCTQLDGEPNSARTYGYVPGSVLRGALAAVYAARKGLADGAALFADDDAQRAFFAVDVRYLNAYPCVGGGRALPASQAWFRSKQEKRQLGDAASVYDRFVTDGRGGEDAAAAKRRAEIVEKANARVAGDDDTFTVRSGSDVILHMARRQVAIHTMRDRSAGRATDEFGAVFRYEALAAGQMLRAHVLVGDAGAEVLKTLLSDDAVVFLGKARTAGYGRAQATLVSDEDAGAWRESTAGLAPAHGPWRLTLLSDALLRDGDGRPGAGAEALRTALADATGVEAAKVEVTAKFVSVRTVGGFNRTWGLPLPQVPAARMGSEYEVTCAAWTSEQLRMLELSGIGERRADGFGRIALRAPDGEETLRETKSGAAGAAGDVVLKANTPAHALAKQMAERLLRRQLDRLVVAKAQEIADRVQRPTVSQLKRMQAVVGDAITNLQSDRTQEGRRAQGVRLRKYMESIEQRTSVRSMFRSGGFAQGGAPWLYRAADLHEWLNARFSDEDKDIDEILEIKGKEPTVGSVTAEMTEPLRREYALRLVHAVLGLAAKRKRRAEGEQK